MVLTDVWCYFVRDDTFVHAEDENHVVREILVGLSHRRWYATSQILSDGCQIIIGDRRQYNYEFYPKNSAADQSYDLPFLMLVEDPKTENNLYLFVFLNVDGNLFIFANNRAILFNYTKAQVVRTYLTLPCWDPMSYPSTGSAVLLSPKIVGGA